MAKLKARGRLELVRVVKENQVADPEREIVWERTTIALMSDGHILKKRDVRFKPMFPGDGVTGQHHSYGWKEFGKTKVTAEVFLDAFVKVGYQKEA